MESDKKVYARAAVNRSLVSSNTAADTICVCQKISTKDSLAMFKHVDWNSVKSETLSPSVERQYISTEQMTVARFHLKKGVVVPTHQHPNEQIAYIVKGALKFTVNGKAVTVRAGETLCIDANVPHM